MYVFIYDIAHNGAIRPCHPSHSMPLATRSTIERGRGCNKLVPVLRGNGTKIAPTGDICVQPPGEMSWIRGKLADHVGDHAVLSPEEVVLVTSSGTKLSHPRPSQSLNNSRVDPIIPRGDQRICVCVCVLLGLTAVNQSIYLACGPKYRVLGPISESRFQE